MNPSSAESILLISTMVAVFIAAFYRFKFAKAQLKLAKVADLSEALKLDLRYASNISKIKALIEEVESE